MLLARTFALFTTALAAATAQSPTTPSTQPVALPAIDVPVIGRIGKSPPDSAPTVGLARDGTLIFGTEIVDLPTCVDRLRAAAWPNGAARTPDGPASELDLLLRADKALPFVVLARLIDACGQPDVAIRRLYFAVQNERGAPGAFAVFLPSEQRDGPLIPLELRRSDAGVAASSALGHLRRVLHRADAQPESRTIGLRVAANVPLGDVLEVLDWAAQAGVEGTTMWLDADEAATTGGADAVDLRTLAAAQVPSPPRLSLEVGGKRITNEPAPRVGIAPAEDYAGFTGPGVWVPGALGLATPTVTDLPPRVDPAGVFGRRFAVDRRMNRGVDAAILQGLEWLCRHQDKDGRWNADGFMAQDTVGAPCDGPGAATHDCGVTGLALLALLADGNTLAAGTRREHVRRGAEWLRRQQRDDGWVGGEEGIIYDHAIGTLALVEVYGTSGLSGWRACAQRGIDTLEAWRNPYSVWRYQPRHNDNDSSITSWCAFALIAARYFDLQVNDNALKLTMTWYDQVTDASGRAGYLKMGEAPARLSADHQTRFPPEKSEALTAAALFVRSTLGATPKDQPAMRGGIELLRQKLPSWAPASGGIDAYYWYYGSLAMEQAGGKAARDWRTALEKALLSSQRHDGNFAGSWDPIDAWGEVGGRVYSTAVLLMSLQAPYRYARWQR